MSAAPTLVLIGAHGAGKTTLGRQLAQVLGWRFDDEIGERLRRQALARDPTAHAAQPQADFDRAVIEAELRRDCEMAASGPRIVETWHLGNLAYARHRSPAVARAYEAQIADAVCRAKRSGPVWVQPLQIDEAALQIRQTEPGPPELARFFLRVADEACAAAWQLGLRSALSLDTTRNSFEQCIAQLVCLVRT